MSPKVRVVHPDDSTDMLTHFGHEAEEEFRKMDQVSVFVERGELNGVTVNETRDEVELLVGGSVEFSGLLQEVVRSGARPELIVSSPEQYAKDAENTPAGQNYDNVADSTIVEDAIDAVDELSRGTIEEIEPATSFVFSYASQARKARKVEETTSGELKYNPDKTVDYVDQLGADKTGTTLSPGNQNVMGDLEVARRGKEDRTTHLVVLGAGEGVHQITATIVPNDDPYDYENDAQYDNVVRYAASNWIDGDRVIWDTYSNKDVTGENAIESLGLTLIEELNTEHLKIEGTVKGPDVNLGDTFHVSHPEENVNDDLRVVKLTWKWDGEHGERYDVDLSNRPNSATEPSSKTVQDVERFNMAVEGVAVPINAGGGRQPVDDAHEYEMRLYYPAEVVYEHRLNVRVIGLPYRAYSQGAASSGGSHDHSVSISDHTHDVEFQVPNHIHSLFNGGTDPDGVQTTDPEDGHTHDYYLLPQTSGVVDASSESTTSKSGGGTTTTSDETTPNHTHEPQPGIIDFGSRLPSDCDVTVNGTSLGTSFGDGSSQFNESVDARGVLNPGQINTVRVSSESLGHLQVYVEGDIYRQILGEG